eukprot:CAMPEP_0184743924 /NCGR_PEP_ID=MMETSP0315-20130426/6704_1 /TAXON_ID=101924 /ORGANISM="Rhodosorus marinus, Strain UTEX LB 2760" /LENGTH=186 /DNA_ID=CAMNT_0027215381 /DNA_START=210 /DNA_END=771 /DNA_ORIENTATION=-
MEVFQVMVAAQMAYQRYSTGKAACRTMHAEVLYCLSAMKSISNVFATFGLDGSQRELLIVVINPHKTIVDEIQRSIDGKEVSDIERSLSTGYDEARIKEVYKISDTELHAGPLLDAVLSRMASKSFLNSDVYGTVFYSAANVVLTVLLVLPKLSERFIADLSQDVIDNLNALPMYLDGVNRPGTEL